VARRDLKLTAQSKAAEKAAQTPPTKKSPPKAREKSGPTEQRNLPRVPMHPSSTTPIARAPAAAAGWRR
jgi:hypothetical protein